MDLSQYVKKDERSWMRGLHGEVREYIDKEIIAQLLGAEDDKVELYAVIASVFKKPQDMYGGFFATAFNAELLLAKNLSPAKKLFAECYNEADEKLYKIGEVKKSKNLHYADFSLFPRGDVVLSFLNNSKPRDLSWHYGETLRLTLNKTQPLSIDSMQYSSKHKAICFTYEYYTTTYVPIVLV